MNYARQDGRNALSPVLVPADVAHEFTDRWDDCLAYFLATKLTCIEVDALAELLRALGAAHQAASWLDTHARRDVPGDAHCPSPEAEPCCEFSTDAFHWSPDHASVEDGMRW